jgi:hypothetical protein
MSTPAEQDERAVSHRIAWADPSRVYARRPLVTQAVLLTVIFVLAVLDAYLMMPALQSVLRLPVETTEKIAYGISAASALAAGWSGHHLRGATGNHPGSRRHLLLPLGVVLGWLALGVLIAVIRLVGGSNRIAVAYDQASTTASTLSASAWTSAGLFLVFYLLVGFLALGDLYHVRQDAAAALRRATRRRDTVARTLRDQEALLRRLVETCSIRHLETLLLAEQAGLVKAGNATHAAELVQLSRHTQAVLLGSPSATGITSTDHPKNPAGEISGTARRG